MKLKKESWIDPAIGNDSSFKSILENVLKSITPTEDDRKRVEAINRDIIQRLSDAAKASEGTVPEITIMGSVAKDTYLKGVSDSDVFLLFPKHISLTGIFETTKRIVEKAFPKEKKIIAYAEHPYLRIINFKGFRIDIVPAYKIYSSSEKHSSVDRTQLHTLFVNTNLKSEQKSEVRLLKQFMKAHRIYGSELKVEGFSGYVCELLIIKFGSFKKTLEAFATWELNKPICFFEQLKGKQEQISYEKFGNPPLLLIDPVDETRNAAAAVSATNLARFVYAARKFLTTPKAEFFDDSKKPITKKEKHFVLKKIAERKTFAFGIKFKKPDMIDDMLYPQLKKASLKIFEALEMKDFQIFGYTFGATQKHCIIIIELYHKTLPHVKKFIGPSILFANNFNQFINAHKKAEKIHIEHFNIVAIEKRKHFDAVETVKHFLKYEKKGIPAELKKAMENFSIISSKQIAQQFPELIYDYLKGLEKF